MICKELTFKLIRVKLMEYIFDVRKVEYIDQSGHTVVIANDLRNCPDIPFAKEML